MHLVACTTLLRESLSGILRHNKHSSQAFAFLGHVMFMQRKYCISRSDIYLKIIHVSMA